jgi:26S proteasome regulatory subunit N2
MLAVGRPAASAAAMPSAGAGQVVTTTASGWLALLREDDATLRAHALTKLLECVDTQWHEVAESLAELEAMAEDVETYSESVRQTAAAVASRVFFYLEEPTQALRLALEAGPLHFQPMDAVDMAVEASSSASGSASSSPYVERLVTAALDAFISAKKKQLEDEDGSSKTTAATDDDVVASLPMDQLQSMVYRLLESSCRAGNYHHALGVALEARETDKVRDILIAASSASNSNNNSNTDLLKYAVRASVNVVTSKSFRQEALQVVATCLEQKFEQAESGHATDAAYDLVWVDQLLGRPDHVAKVLAKLLLHGTADEALLGLQLCFDLMDSGDQAFVNAVAKSAQAHKPRTTTSTATTEGGDAAAVATTTMTPEVEKRWDQAMRVLVGGFSAELALSFLHKQSKADRLIMENLKRALEERTSGSRSSVLHTSAVVTHSYLYAGTTNDSFLRDYLDWMKKASNWYVFFILYLDSSLSPPCRLAFFCAIWNIICLTRCYLLLFFWYRAKFSATASLGVVHASHISEAMNLLQPYLPANPTADGASAAAAISPSGGYAEGGSLYALGLIHGANAGTSAEKRLEATEFLRSHLRVSHTNEAMSHGAALGVGLTAMGAADLAIVQELKELLDTDSAVAGEAAGIAIGMVLVGTGAGNTHNTLPNTAQKEEIMEIVAELKNYARETQHEKIIRGIAMGLALINFGQEENADALIEEMRSDRDPVMRYGAQYALSLAYCGTGSNKAIRILLHTAVSDVSDDVRMAAVIGLAFVLFKTPDRVPDLVKLLLESFNPHVRYASCMAVGIAMAGSGDSHSIAMLEPMLEDMTDYVRQGALMGTAMIYMQQSDTCNGRKIRTFREKLATIVTEKHHSTLTKMGAILSTGIIDAGGRNCSLALGSRNGFTKMSSAGGLALWLQHWHWYPMMHMLSLALTPTCTIGLNADFKYPRNFEITCNSKPSVFAYPKKLEEKKEEKKKRVETVTLSTTAKEKARLARKRAKMGGGDATTTSSGDKEPSATAMDVDKEEGSKPEAAAADGATTEDGETTAAAADAMEIDKDGDAALALEKKPKKKREPEPTSFRLGNPTRITMAQSKVCEFDLNQRYRPIRSEERPFGVIVLTDSTPEEEEDLGAVMAPSLEPEGELPPPEPFEWTPPAPATSATPTTSSEPPPSAAEPYASKKEEEEGSGDQPMEE